MMESGNAKSNGDPGSENGSADSQFVNGNGHRKVNEKFVATLADFLQQYEVVQVERLPEPGAEEPGFVYYTLSQRER